VEKTYQLFQSKEEKRLDEQWQAGWRVEHVVSRARMAWAVGLFAMCAIASAERRC